ncbi:MAG: ABC transporter substrate-binding protein, partial [Planctomycetota bacterium]
LASLLVLLLIVAGCDRPEPPPAGTDGGGDASAEPGADRPGAAAPTGPPRIVSLSPAISRTLVDLGAADLVVGRSRFCQALDPGIPVAGDLTDIDYELLVRLEATHLLLQPPGGVVSDEIRRQADAHGWRVGAWRINTIADINALMNELPALIHGDRPERVTMMAQADRQRNHFAAALGAESTLRFRGRVLLVHTIDPVGVFGRQTYLHEILEGLGAANAVNTRGWGSLSMEDVVRIDPEAVVIVRPAGGDAGADPAEATRVLSELPIAAARTGRIAVLSHPDALLPSSAVGEVAEELAEILVRFARLQTGADP